MTASQLLQVASSIDDSSVTGNVEDLSEPELYDLIVDYVRSEKLISLEDGGMSQLLLLNNMLNDSPVMDPGAAGDVQMAPPEKEDSTTQPEGYSTPPHPDHNQPARRPVSPTTDTPTTPHSSMDRDVHVNPPEVRRDPHTPQSPAGRDSIVSARNPATPAKPSSSGFVGAPPGRASLSSSMGDQVLRLNDVAALLQVTWWTDF